MIRLLLDQGIPRSTTALLNAAGWDAVHVGDVNLSRAADTEILEFAGAEKRTIVTLDADFHAILAVTNARGPSTIRFRRQGLDGPTVASLLRSIWPDIEAHATRGAMITVTEHDVRVRQLPLSPQQD